MFAQHTGCSRLSLSYSRPALSRVFSHCGSFIGLWKGAMKQHVLVFICQWNCSQRAFLHISFEPCATLCFSSRPGTRLVCTSADWTKPITPRFYCKEGKDAKTPTQSHPPTSNQSVTLETYDEFLLSYFTQLYRKKRLSVGATGELLMWYSSSRLLALAINPTQLWHDEAINKQQL